MPKQPMVLTSLLALLLAAGAASPRAVDSLEARAAVRNCLKLEAPPEESVDSCRQAVALGLHPEWSQAIRVYLARRLAALGRWDEVVEIYRGLTLESPTEAAWPLRLGSALLFGTGREAEAEGALREALSRDPRGVEPWALLGVALQARGRAEEAVASFARARALDPAYLDSRPALAEIEKAASGGAAWP